MGIHKFCKHNKKEEERKDVILPEGTGYTTHKRWWTEKFREFWVDLCDVKEMRPTQRRRECDREPGVVCTYCDSYDSEDRGWTGRH
jgi:hypothetical protein